MGTSHFCGLASPAPHVPLMLAMARVRFGYRNAKRSAVLDQRRVGGLRMSVGLGQFGHGLRNRLGRRPVRIGLVTGILLEEIAPDEGKVVLGGEGLPVGIVDRIAAVPVAPRNHHHHPANRLGLRRSPPAELRHLEMGGRLGTGIPIGVLGKNRRGKERQYGEKDFHGAGGDE
jgi:hypothetical protein